MARKHEIGDVLLIGDDSVGGYTLGHVSEKTDRMIHVRILDAFGEREQDVVRLVGEAREPLFVACLLDGARKFVRRIAEGVRLNTWEWDDVVRGMGVDLIVKGSRIRLTEDYMEQFGMDPLWDESNEILPECVPAPQEGAMVVDPPPSGCDDDGMPVLLAGLTGELRIELTQPPEPITPALANLAAKPDARVLSVRLEVEVWEDDSDESRPLSEEEWNTVVLEEPRLVLRNESDADVPHDAPNGASFTTRDVIAAVEETERRTRGASDWFGGVDVHHVYFEGLELEEEDPPVWRACWGS